MQILVQGDQKFKILNLGWELTLLGVILSPEAHSHYLVNEYSKKAALIKRLTPVTKALRKPACCTALKLIYRFIVQLVSVSGLYLSLSFMSSLMS